MRKLKQLISEGGQRLREVQQQPSIVLTWIKKSLINTWLLRGGGFYGLGYLATFLLLQAQSLANDIQEAEDALGFVSSQIFQAMFKLFTDVIGNLIQAFIWPLLLLNSTGTWGLLLLLVGFIGFDRWGKAYINDRVPELHAADMQRQLKLAEKRKAKQEKKQAKRDKREQKKVAKEKKEYDKQS